MKRLPRIPSPPSHYWREFRHAVLPFIVFFGVLAGAVVLWQKHIAPPGIIGEVEMVRANVTTTTPGTVANLKVDLMEKVQKGQEICTIMTADADTLKASLEAVAADLDTLRARMMQDQHRNKLDYENLRMNLLTRRVELATDRVNLQYASNEFQRAYQLFQEKSDSQFQFEYWRNQRDALDSKVNDLTRLVSEMEQALERVRPASTMAEEVFATEAVAKAIETKQEEMRMLAKPVTLKAPMDGIISVVYRRSGEKVVLGEPIVTISALQTARIIGYVRQPLNVQPKEGDLVDVRARTQKRPVARARVLAVGSQLEPISSELLPPTFTANANPLGRTFDGRNYSEYGLPIVVNLPEGLKLAPGEIVDMELVSPKTDGP